MFASGASRFTEVSWSTHDGHVESFAPTSKSSGLEDTEDPLSDALAGLYVEYTVEYHLRV